MKKISFWSLLLGLAFGSLTFVACGGDDDDDNTTENRQKDNGDNHQNPGDDNTPPGLEVNETNLQGTWDGSVDADFAQGYYQRWRLKIEGKTYTSWHTHLTAGTINDEVQGVKTVGNKEQGTWEYTDGKLILTPTKQWASYYLTAKSMNDPYYTVYYDYNTETMESNPWYEVPEYLTQDGVARDLEDGINGNEFYIQVWPVVSLTKTELSVRINRDTFKLTKQ